MKKNSLYIVLLLLFFGAAGFVVLKFRNHELKKNAASYGLLERKGVSVQTKEWADTKKAATSLLNAIKADPADTKSMIALINLFVMEARATGNYQYYDVAAMKYANDVLAKDPANFEGLTFKSLLFLSQHHFADGLAVAGQAVSIDPYNAFLYGVLVDGHVEMGNYDSAVWCAEKMMSIRPDLRSYARASYLREIYGDYPGAIEAMKLAVDAGAPGDESTEWSRVHLGQLYENTGDLENAAMSYDIALEERPGYVHALAGLARLATCKKDYQRAINYYLQADSLSGDPSFREALVDLYELASQKDKAITTAKQVIEEMNRNTASAAYNDNMGHYADRELAYAYLKTGDNGKALEHALAEYNRRPKNIDVNETLAEVYYQMGEYQKAAQYIKVALKTGSRNPALLCKAGMIFSSVGDKEGARIYLKQALQSNANIPVALKTNSEHELSKL